MDYKGFDIHVRRDCVVLGEDPMGPTTEGFVAEVRKPDPVQGDPDGRTIWDYPFGLSASLFEAGTEDEAIEKAKAFIDAGGKPTRPSVGPREED